MFDFYKRLTQIAAPWALVVECFEREPLVVTLAKEKYRIFTIPADSILTPTKERTEFGYFKIARNISAVKIIANDM